MTKQPEALWLARELDAIHTALWLARELDAIHTTHVARNAAVELRRLHAENERLHAQRAELLEALKMASRWVEGYTCQMGAVNAALQADNDLSVIYAAFAVEEGETK